MTSALDATSPKSSALSTFSLPHLSLYVLGGGFDLDLPFPETGLVARLGENGRPIDDLATAQVEAGVVQGANDGVTLALALLQRTAEVVAGGPDGADLAARRTTQEHANPSDLDPAQLVLVQITLIEDRRKLLGASFLEDVPVHAQAVVVGELPAEVGGHAADRIPRQKRQASRVAASRGPLDERDDAEDQADGVEQPVGYPHPPRTAGQVPPVGETGDGGPERPQRTEHERGVGRVPHGLVVCDEVETVEDEGCGPGPDGYVSQRGMQRCLEPDAVERVARRNAAGFYGLLHLVLYGVADPVQEGQCLDHALHEGLRHLFRLSSK